MKHLPFLYILLCLVANLGVANSSDGRIKIRKKSSLKFNYSTSEEFNAEKQALLSKKRAALIGDIKKFIRESSSADQKAELNLRLGGLYVEEYHSLLAKAQTDTKKGNTQFDTSEAMAYLDKAVTIYKDLLTRFPNHPRKDEMLYSLALLNQDKGKNDEAISFFQGLINNFPSSKYAVEAHLQIGDHYFDKGKFKESIEHFEKAIERKDSKTLPYAKYKKAWAYFNSQQYKLSLTLFKEVIDSESSENSAQLIRLKNEALRDIALPFVELGMGDQAMRFYEAQEAPHNRTGIESLASLFLEKGNYQQAITLHEKLISMDPNNAKNPDFELALITAIRLSSGAAKAISRLFNRAPLYLSGSTWYELHSGAPETVKAASTQFEENARKYALELHAEGQKTKNDKLYGEARNLYEQYLEFFGSTQYAPTIRFYLAEILYKQKQYTLAANQYYAVYRSPSAGNLRLDSIRYALNALGTEMNTQRKKSGLTEITTVTAEKVKETEGEPTATPLTTVETQFLEVADDYISHFPKVSDTADILYQTGYLKYTHLNFPEAYKTFWSVVNTFPGLPSAYSSAYLILDILNRRNEFPKMVQACNKFLSVTAFSKPDFKKEVGDILRRSELKRISGLEQDGEFLEAAGAYVEYTKAHGTADEKLLENALNNAAVNFSKGNDILSAIEVQERFLRRFPNSPLKENTVLQIAKNYESLTNFEKAASYFEQFALQFPSNKQASVALRLAALYYWGSRNETKAEKLMKLHLERFPKDFSTVSQDLLDLYESQGAIDKQMSFFVESRKRKGISYADYLANTLKIADLQQAQSGEMPVATMEEALKVTQKHSKSILQSSNGAEQMAKTLFWFATQKEQLFYKVKLALPQRNLELNLKRKLALLKEIEKEFSHIAKLGGGEWGLGAIYKTASAYRALAEDIAEAPVPSELSGEQLDQYRTELKKQLIIPFSEKALGLVTQCLDKAEEHVVFSRWTPQCYSLGTELNEEKYPVVKTFYVSPLRVAVMENVPDSKISKGKMGQYEYPFESTALFSPAPAERAVASVPSSSQSFIEGPLDLNNERNRTLPSLVNYSALEPQRKEVLSKGLQSNQSGKVPSYSYLHYMRLSNPQKALSLITQAIKKDPNNVALHNLLGLCFLDLGHFNSAKITWLSLLARGVNSTDIQNNLGVLAFLQGNEKQAISFFQAAAAKNESPQALTNLGYIALKYRSGFEAKKYFQKAISLTDEDVSSFVGLGIAQLQNREFDTAKETLKEASSKFEADPLANLSLAYLVLDIDKDASVASQIIENLRQNQSEIEKDSNFRKALQDIRKERGTPGLSSNSKEELPSLNN